MKDEWFEEKKDFLIKDLVDEYCKTRVFFDELYKQYKKGDLEFQKMRLWVGTELKKGALWNLKDLCHSLFRDRELKIGVRELLFDWTLGSIFHECMKLKEDVYQLEAYWPRYKEIEESKDVPFEIKDMLRGYAPVVKKTEEDLKKGMGGIDYLFSKATMQLRDLLPKYSKNGLLIRLLIDKEDIVNAVFGKDTLAQIFDSMFPGRFEEAYYIAGKNLLEGGWHKKAIELFKKALTLNPNNSSAREKLNIAKERLRKFTG